MDEKQGDPRPEEPAGEPVLASVVAEPTATAGGRPPIPPLPRKKEEHQPPVSWREPIALLALAVLCDLIMYRGNGFAGYAVLFATAPALLWLGSPRPRLGRDFWLVVAMLLVLAVKMVWCGSWLLVGVGFALVVALAMTMVGQHPYVLAAVVFASQTIRAGCDGLNYYGRRLAQRHTSAAGVRWLNVVLPLTAFLLFSIIFIVANPDVLKNVSEQLQIAFGHVRDWLLHFSIWEVIFWIGVLWIGVGLMRPVAGRLLPSDEPPADEQVAVGEPSPTPLYAAYRNTLAVVIILFAVYLVFEFNTLWFHTFKEGFYYSGYAHNGAAWLTVALGLATVILSLVFSERTLQDPRLGQLRCLAWIWSLQNFVLAAAVYNRLGIYIGFNGMTRMRIVGIFGMSAVVVGFILVLWKIAHNRTFAWLLRRHLLTVAVAVYLFALTPLDTIVVSYNVRQILAGDLNPSVQITEHPINSEGILLLEPLLECKDPIICEGVRAMLAQRDQQAEALAKGREELGWTAYQMADDLALKGLRAGRAQWDTFKDPAQRQKTYDAFKEYAYQWY